MLVLLEVFALIVSIILGFMWIKEPQGIYEPFIVSAGFTFIGAELYRRSTFEAIGFFKKSDKKCYNITPDRLAAVCYRFEHGEVKFLMIRSSSKERWNFQKGMFDTKKRASEEIKRIIDGEAGVLDFKIIDIFFCKMIHYQKSDDQLQLISIALVEVFRAGVPRDIALGIERKPSYFNKNEVLEVVKEGRDSKEVKEIHKVISLAYDQILLNNRM